MTVLPEIHPTPRTSRQPPEVVLHTRVVTETGGGPDKTILNSPRFLEEHGYRALCAYMHPPDDPGFNIVRGRAAESGARLLSVPDRGAWDWRVARQLLAICRQEGVTIWHAHDYKSNAIGLLLRRWHPMHLVTTVHGWVRHTRRTPLYYWIDRHCLRRYERVICVSPDLVERCLAAGVPAERCLLIENAIDTDQYARRLSPAEAKRKAGLNPERLVIGAVGRLSPEKGFDRLIRAFATLVTEGLDTELVIAGDGDERSRLQELATSLPCGDRVWLLGHRTDMIDLYQAMDVFALSSLREGLPNVLLEAMSLEVPVVATRIAGVPKLIEHDSNGLLVPADDIDSLADALRRLVGDPALRTRLAVTARQTIEERYSFAVRMEKVRAVYAELLRQDSP